MLWKPIYAPINFMKIYASLFQLFKTITIEALNLFYFGIFKYDINQSLDFDFKFFTKKVFTKLKLSIFVNQMVKP